MKKVLLFLISFLLLINNIEATDLKINSQYGYVYNVTEKKVMYEKNSYEEIKVASLTKIMTAIIVIENNKDLNKSVTILDEDLRDMYEYTTAGFKNGDVVTIKDLLYGILLPSGSDAVNAAVRITSESEEEFVDLMNKRAKQLNLTHTHFSNPIGKDEKNYSSMSDMAKIMEYCLKNKIFKEVISTTSKLIEPLNIQLNGPLYNTLGKYNIDTSMVSGSKSGYTSESKFSMISYYEKDNLEYIVATSYAGKYKDSVMDTSNIYNYFLSNYNYYDYNINYNINVVNGKKNKYNVDINTKLYLANNYDKSLISYKYNGKKNISFLQKKGDKLGTISIYYNKELIKTVSVILDKDIEYKKSIHVKLLCILGIICMFLLLVIIKKFKKVQKKHKKLINKKIEIMPVINDLKIEEPSKENNLKVLEKTNDIDEFFNELKSITEENLKVNLERSFIDRCFRNIDFSNIEELQELYTKLKIYKKDMNSETIEYYTKLFKYCIKNYIDKK